MLKQKTCVFHINLPYIGKPTYYNFFTEIIWNGSFLWLFCDGLSKHTYFLFRFKSNSYLIPIKVHSGYGIHV